MIYQKNILKLSVSASLFLFSLSYSQQNKGIIENYLASNVKKTVKDFNITDSHRDKSLGGDVVNIQQTYKGIPVYGAISSTLVKNNQVSYLSDAFLDIDTGKNASVGNNASYDIKENFSEILKNSEIKGESKDYIFTGKKSYTVLSQLVYYPELNNTLKLAYAVNFYGKGTNNYWNVIVDAVNGKILEKSNLTTSCTFNDHPYTFEAQPTPFIGPQKNNGINRLLFKENNLLVNDASYRVFPLPIEAPTFGDRQFITNPWSDASPNGWQKDGDTEYNITRGNNAYAYLDLAGTNTDQGSADGGTGHLFDFPLSSYTLNDNTTDSKASVTNLFYVNNMMHDIFYKFGFDEAGRNFQATNFGKGEAYTDEDPVLAESRDGSAYNNANFSTPPDGFAPRMQMYLWKYGYLLGYNAPAEMTPRKPSAGYNLDFGGAFPTTTPITADVKIASPLDACTALGNTDLNGRIALIQRGNCNFDVKFKNAQNSGALAVIIYNADSSQTIGNMSGTDTTVTIPGVLVDNTEGTLIKSQIESQNNVNVNLLYNSFYIDGSLDNGVIAHEYTHGISTRSTGNGSTCLNYASANEQMGEGWSDFFSMMVTNKPEANDNYTRGIGTFVNNQSQNEAGIRPAKYSPDFSINNYTYGSTNGMYFNSSTPDVHSIGFVWATMLWDLHWKFAEKYGFSNDIVANPESGSAKVVKLVYESFKLQGCFPNFIKGRDAIIAADQNINNGNNKCMIWKTFAKRGLGVNASPGATRGDTTTALNDQIEDFSVPEECAELSTSEVSNKCEVVLYPNPGKNEVHILTKNNDAKRISVTIFDLVGNEISRQMIDIANNDAINTFTLSNGVYIVKGESISLTFNKKLVIKK